jgi:formylglycine-generating enzyme required for sulfatase activity
VTVGLDPLLLALRESGLPVGVTEVARLRQVFALGPRWDGDAEGRRLKTILRAVLVKSSEGRAIFDGVFETWLRAAVQDLDLPAPFSPAPAPRPAPRRRGARRYLWRATASIVFLLSLTLGGHVKVRPSRIEPTPEPTPTQVPAPTPQPTPVSEAATVSLDDIRHRTFTTWVPTITVTPAKPEWQGEVPLSLAVAALAAAGGLWLILRRRSWLPKAAPPPGKKGPPRVFLTPPPDAGPELLVPRDEEAIVWGIGHFVTDEPTRRLDLRATVRATAQAAGIPHLCFERARHHREVWLWVDEAAAEADPAVERLAVEVETALRAYGLPVERSLFRGVPDLLTGVSGGEFAPNEVDERRDAALVAILTDGRLLARHYAADDQRVRLDALLRALSHWPRLAFVDFAAEPGPLSAILPKHALARIKPPDLAAFLSGGETPRLRGLPGAEAAWAAACALAPSSVDERRAYALRRHLGLTASPWAFRGLRAEAPGPAGRLHWLAALRARRINWLRTAEGQGDHIAPGSVLGRALAFWERSYDQELKNPPAGAEVDTPAHLHLHMERNLLRLWRDREEIGAAVSELYRLHGGTLREAVERHLAGLAPMDYGKEEHVHLPWCWADRKGSEQLMLRAIGLGGGMPAVALRRSGRLMTGIGLCAGLAVGAFLTAALSRTRVPAGQLVVVHVPSKPAAALVTVTQRRGGLKLTIQTHKSIAEQTVSEGSQVRALWDERALPCVVSDRTVQLWRCGTLVAPDRVNEAPGMRVIGLAATPGSAHSEALAAALIDSGSADVVKIQSDWRSVDPSRMPLLVLDPGSPWAELAQDLYFMGTKPASTVWPNLKLVAGNPNALLRGLNEMSFVHIPRGTFTMGSAVDDLRASSEEKPAHEVILSEYWIGKYEVTKAQYDGEGSDTLPATGVSWIDADAFCRRNGWRLPTEAEWEYAARAGSRSAWSFGNDEKALGEYAWFEGNSGFDPHPVGTKKPNVSGIYDMYGNAWEWVNDWHGPYDDGSQTDPRGPSQGEGRVLRGGAFFVSPRDLRSASRLWEQPTLRLRFVGFRCARGPSPPTPLPPPSQSAGRGAPPPNK